MRSIEKALQDHELIVLRVIGEWWELDLTGDDKATCVAKLAELMPQLDIPGELISLPPDEAEAIRALVRQEGRMPVASFKRQYGDVRAMGPGALEREEPWFDPQSSAEDLWYRGFLYRGFDQTDEGMVEFFYLPNELLAQFEPTDFKRPAGQNRSRPANEKAEEVEYVDEDEMAGEAGDFDPDYEEGIEIDAEIEGPPVKKPRTKLNIKTPKWAEELLAQPAPEPPATPSPPPASRASAEPPPVPPASVADNGPTKAPPLKAAQPSVSDANDDISKGGSGVVDDFATLLTLAHAGRLIEGQLATVGPYLLEPDPTRINWLLSLGQTLNLLKPLNGGVRPTKAVVDWLQQSREAQIRSLADGWLRSGWNDLRMVPSLRCEGSGWENDPIPPRNALLNSLAITGEWLAIDEVAAAIKAENPDFQRPNGNYDTWYIRDLMSNAYVTGFESWDIVEGRLIRYLIEKPLHWLGMCDLAGPRYRLTERGLGWLEKRPPAESVAGPPLIIQESGVIEVPFETDRFKRFKVGRIATLLPLGAATTPNAFAYRLTPNSLEKARNDSIGPNRVLDFLKSEHSGPLPGGLARSIERWAQNGTEGFVESVVILRVKESQILDTLRKHQKTRPFIADSLSDTVAIVMADHWADLVSAAASLGLLLEPVSVD